jgi:hypothetical protein
MAEGADFRAAVREAVRIVDSADAPESARARQGVAVANAESVASSAPIKRGPGWLTLEPHEQVP